MNLDTIINPLLIGITPAESLRSQERALGFEIVLPGEVPWLSRADWDDSVVVSKDSKRVRLVALKARDPGHGALKRTIAGITACGLEPVVVEPFAEMQATLQRWGWKHRRIGHGDLAHAVWYPRR
jgi:hypothetical protein